MSDQYPKHRILAYYSAGCKAYALRLQNKESGKDEYVIKVKGIELNTAASKTIHYEQFQASGGEGVEVFLLSLI